MSDNQLRDAIAAEAARLIVRGHESDFGSARNRAARWLAKRKLDADDLPLREEIQTHIYALTGLFQQPHSYAEATQEDVYTDDVLAVFRMLLMRLESVMLNPQYHPEGDALYHSLQVYELGRAESPYDEEFLLACLLHDAGLAIDRKSPVQSAIQALHQVVTERTLYLIEHRPTATDYLASGKLPRSLRRSEHYDDLMLLARCDRDGREPGMPVGTVDDALAYIAGLSTAWDD